MKPARKAGRLRRWLTWIVNAWAAPASIDGNARIAVHMVNKAAPCRRLAS